VRARCGQPFREEKKKEIYEKKREIYDKKRETL
jgi:hypothetical protein